MKKQFRGMLITIMGASMWGLCAVAGKYVMGTKGVDPVWMVTLRLLTAGMLLAGMMLVPVAKLWIVSGEWDAGTLLGFGFVVIFGTVTAFAAFLYGVTIVGPLKGSILGLIEPVVAAFSSALILKQKFMMTDVIGVAAILGGVLLLAIYKKAGEH